MQMMQHHLFRPEVAPVTTLALFCTANATLAKLMRFYADPVHISIKLVDFGARLLFPLCGAYTSNPHRTFSKALFELLGGYKAGRVPLIEGHRGGGGSNGADVPVGTVEKDEVFVPSHLPDTADIKVRIYRAKRAAAAADDNNAPPPPIFLYVHGGGFVISHVDSFEYDAVCCDLAQSGYVVVSVEYRLAPEHPWPAAIHDAYSVLLWCHADVSTTPGRNHALLQGADVTKLVVGGDSAGGNCSAILSHLCKNRLDSNLAPVEGVALAAPYIHKLLLVYPSCGCRNSFWSGPHFREHGHVLSGRLIDFFHEMYKPRSMSMEDWLADVRVSPLLNADFAGLPTSVVITADLDQLVDEGTEYCRRLMEAGVECSHVRVHNTAHGFWGMTFLDEYQWAFKQAIALLAMDNNNNNSSDSSNAAKVN
jgi:acetyl esterase